MGIELYWDDDELRTLLCVFNGHWTWEELQATLATIHRITEDVDHEVSAIIDLRKGMTFPGGTVFNAQGLENAKRLLQMKTRGTGRIAIVGGGGVLRSVYDALRTLDPRAVSSVMFADTLKAAREALQPVPETPRGLT